MLNCRAWTDFVGNYPYRLVQKGVHLGPAQLMVALSFDENAGLPD